MEWPFFRDADNLAHAEHLITRGGVQMRGKRKELADAVIRAAREWARDDADDIDSIVACNAQLAAAVEAYDAYDAAVLTGAGAQWAEGSETSRQAAFLAAPLQATVRYEILALMVNVPPLAHPGYTDRQLEARLHGSHQTVSSARNWLCKGGWLEDSGLRRVTNGRPAVVWQLTPAGRRKLTGGQDDSDRTTA